MQPWMKTTALLLIGFLLGITATSLVFKHYCRPHHPPGVADTNRILDRLTTKLNLTADQKSKTLALLDAELPKADALREGTDKKFKDLRETFNTKFKALLTPDQQKKFDEMVVQHDKRMAESDHFFGCNGPSMDKSLPSTPPPSGE